VFVQTAAKLTRESEVLLRIRTAGSEDFLELQTRVARRRSIPPQLASLSSSGIALEIRKAPDAYYERVGVDPPIDNVKPSPDEIRRALQRFRVWVRRNESCRSRALSVDAPDDETARALALEGVGDDWEILGNEAA